MAPTVNGTAQTAQSQNNNLEQLVADGKARVQIIKPKVTVTADRFATAQEDTSKPVVTAEMTVDADGRLVIVLPLLSYADSRDTTSQSRRSFYCQSTERIDGFIAHPETGEPIPVTFALTGLNLSASARKVSAPR